MGFFFNFGMEGWLFVCVWFGLVYLVLAWFGLFLFLKLKVLCVFSNL